MDYNELLNDFAAQFAIDGLEIDDGATALEIDGTAVRLLHDAEADALTLVADIGLPPPDADGAFDAMALKANYLFSGTGGAALIQNPETGAYAICRSLPLAGLDAAALGERVGAIVDQAENWRRTLDGVSFAESEQAAAAEESAPAEESFSPLAARGGFMQV